MMKKIAVFFLLVGWALSGWGSTLVLKNSAEVSDSIVRIKDIAISGRSMAPEIGNLVVAVSPELGATQIINRQEIYEKLVGNGVENPVIKGPGFVRVIRKATTISPDYFKSHIRDYILTNSRWKDGLTVNIVSSKKIVAPVTGVHWRIIPANGQDFFGNVLFKLIAVKGGESVFSTWIVAKIKIQKKVPVTNQDIQKFETITADKIRWEIREITVFNKNAILEPEELLGRKAGRLIRTNSIISKEHLERRFLVRRGALATLAVRFKSIEATSRVKALADGGYGDTIKVMNSSSKKILTAVVTGENKLEAKVE